MDAYNKPRPAYEYMGGENWVDAALQYERYFRADHYAIPKKGGVNLNKASIPKIIDEVLAEVQKCMQRWKIKGLSDKEKDKIEATARKKAAALLGSQNPAEIMFGRNTTETISFAYWLAGQYEFEGYKATALLSDAENPSVYRATHVNLDNGNRDKKDPLTTYSNLSKPGDSTYTAPDEWLRHSSFNICLFGGYLDEDLEKMKANIEEIMSECHKKPGLMIISHVLRHNGRVMPVRALIQHAKAVKKHHYPDSPELFVCVDGAMSFGNLPQCDIDELGCDMYAISPHKTLGSPTLGVARMNFSSPLIQEHLPVIQEISAEEQIVLKKMFDPSLNIHGNIDEEINPAALLGFSKTLDHLEKQGTKEGNDFSRAAKKRLTMKQYAQEQLGTLKKIGIPITFTPAQDGSPFILSFNLFGAREFEPAYWPGFINPFDFEPESREKKIAQKLDERGISLSFIRRGKIFRISFHWDTTKEDIDTFIAALKEILQSQS